MSPDIDTGANRDPEPSQETLLKLRDRMMARLEAGAPVRLIRVAHLRTTAWRSDARKVNGGRDVVFPSSGRAARFSDRTALRCQVLAETGEHLGLDRVGLIIGSEELTP